MHVIHNQPSVGKAESRAVERVLKSKWLIGGKEVKKFEKEFARYIGSRYAIAVTSGHAALHLSLLALGVSEGDEVLMPAYTVSDVINAIYYTGAKPILVDNKKDSFVMDSKSVKKHISKKTKAIIIVHTFGFSADVEKIKKIGIPIIEDCAQSLGTKVSGDHLGISGSFGIFSFYATKMITTGQGGMVVTNSSAMHTFIQERISYNAPSSYMVRYNYPMNDILASIGRVQVKKLPEFLEKRKNIGDAYRAVLQRKQVSFWPKKREDSNHFRFLLQFPDIKKRDLIEKEFLKQSIVTIHPLKSEELAHNLLKKGKNNFPDAQTMADTVLSLPLYPGLTEDQVDYISKTLENIL